MTVKELIEQLQKADPDIPVFVTKITELPHGIGFDMAAFEPTQVILDDPGGVAVQVKEIDLSKLTS